MKVEVHIVYLCAVEALEVELESLAQLQLVALPVQQVHDQLPRIGPQLALEVVRERLQSFVRGVGDAGARVVLEVGLLSPEEGNGAARLHERRPRVSDAQQLLGLDLVGDPAVLVDAARLVARARPVSAAARDEDEVEAEVVDEEHCNVHVSPHDRQHEFVHSGVVEGLQHVRVPEELLVEAAVERPEEDVLGQLEGLLHGVEEVEAVGEVEVLVAEQGLDDGEVGALVPPLPLREVGSAAGERQEGSLREAEHCLAPHASNELSAGDYGEVGARLEVEHAQEAEGVQHALGRLLRVYVRELRRQERP
mmetsp:Transcript_19278/g.74036  ORF Transcript_19278/g.74036 Transcript_19278/m.74036 type:complete len:308 (-) Transcript_19278:160-1083(-)